jgi:hypothetical protein
VQQYPSQAPPQVRSVLSKLLYCRTPDLGDHLYRCDQCNHQCRVYNSCGDRHCPQCSGAKRADWLDSTASLLLPDIPYFQVVFTIPDQLSSLTLGNRRVMFDLLFRSAWSSLKRTVEAEQQFEAAAAMVLHTWNQHVDAHIHVVKYLARYMTGGPISDRRLIRHEDEVVTFAARVGKTHGGSDETEEVAFSGVEFVRRWCLHILPQGYTKTRRFGGYSPRHCKRYMAECRRLLPMNAASADDQRPAHLPVDPADPNALSSRRCPNCETPMRLVSRSIRPSWLVLPGPFRQRAIVYDDG